MKDTKSNEKISLIESVLCYIEEDCEALLCLYDGLENEGRQSGEHIEDWRAIAMVRRMPMFLSVMNVIRRDLNRNVKEIGNIVNGHKS